MALKKQSGKHPQRSPLAKPEVSSRAYHIWIIGILAFLLYAQTISYEYVYDDASIITENSVTRQGLKGIKDIFSHAYWYGLQGSDQGVYRPISQLSFALDWQFFPDSPKTAHLMNVLLYGLCCMLLYRVLIKVFKNQNPWIPFSIALLYTLHPVHTEVVANIKSRDEILCLIFGLLSCLYAIKYVNARKNFPLILSSICIFFSLLSKESGIAFILISPLILYFIHEGPRPKLLFPVIALAIPLLLFFVLRNRILEPMQAITLSDNAILAATTTAGQIATAFYVLGRYILLLIFPINLSSDYSFAAISPQTFLSPFVLFSILIYSFGFFYACFQMKDKDKLSLFIFIFLISIFPVSNLLLIIGTAMAERFLFIPSLGFLSIPVLLLAKYFKIKDREKGMDYTFKNQSKKYPAFFIIVILIGFLFSVSTFNRNKAWKNNMSLFSTDIATVPNSARIHNNYGNALYKKGDMKSALTEFNVAISLNPSFDQAYNNAALVYGQSGQLDTCIALLKKAISITPNYLDAHNSMGIALGGKGMFDESIREFEFVLKLNPGHSQALKNLGLTYYNKKDYPHSLEVLNKAMGINKKDADIYQIIGLNYRAMGNENSANEFLDKAASLR